MVASRIAKHYDLVAFDPHCSVCIGTAVDPALGLDIASDIRFRVGADTILDHAVGADTILDHAKRRNQSNRVSVGCHHARYFLVGMATLFESDVSLAREPERQRRGRLRGVLYRDHCDLVLRRRMFVSSIDRRTWNTHDGTLG